MRTFETNNVAKGLRTPKLPEFHILNYLHYAYICVKTDAMFALYIYIKF